MTMKKQIQNSMHTFSMQKKIYYTRRTGIFIERKKKATNMHLCVAILFKPTNIKNKIVVWKLIDRNQWDEKQTKERNDKVRESR
jgi:hypothetical protein